MLRLQNLCFKMTWIFFTTIVAFSFPSKSGALDVYLANESLLNQNCGWNNKPNAKGANGGRQHNFYYCFWWNVTIQERICVEHDVDPASWFNQSALEFLELAVVRLNCLQHEAASHVCSQNSSARGSDVTAAVGNQARNACCTAEPFQILQEKICQGTAETAKTCKTDVLIYVVTIVAFIFGFVALTGNVIVIVDTALRLKRKRVRLSRVEKTHNVMILNLTVADFLMAIYLLCLATMKQMIHFTYEWCSAIAIINFISSQVSVTALVIITSVRMYSVTFPYKRISLKNIQTVILITWVVWVALAILPSLNVDSIRSFFTDSISFRNDAFNMSLSYDDLLSHTEAVLKEFNLMCNFTDDSGYYFPQQRSWKSMLALSQQLTLIDLNYLNDILYEGFYSWDFCAMDLLIQPHQPYMFYTMFVIMYNLLSFIFIFISQIIICRKSSTDITVQVLLSNCCRKSKENRQIHTHRRELENYKMHRRMFFIVLTDFFCWIPLLTISLYYFILSNFEGSDELLENIDCWFPTLLIVLLPINSAINPFLYSSHVWEIVWDKIKGCFNKPQDGVQDKGTELKSMQTSLCHIDRRTLDLTQIRNEDDNEQ